MAIVLLLRVALPPADARYESGGLQRFLLESVPMVWRSKFALEESTYTRRPAIGEDRCTQLPSVGMLFSLTGPPTNDR